MNKRGFTLVELVAIITLLAVILMIVVPTVGTSIKNARENSYLKQIDLIEKAAKNFGVENDHLLPEFNSNQIITIDFNTLYTSGYLKDKAPMNPKTEEGLTGCVKVSYNSDYNQYEYKYIDNLVECDNYNINNK
ncbi:MAG: type II secretion system protein [Firmicutes bacterium]|nr:type II secretion system protein [Bacillota bacterium]